MRSTLISTFLDFAPVVFSPSVLPAEIEVRLVVATAQITRTLYGAILQGETAVGLCWFGTLRFVH